MQTARQYYPETDNRDYSQERRKAVRNVPKYQTGSAPKPKRRRRKKATDDYTRVRKGSKNMPSIFRRGNIFFIVESERGQYRLPRPVLITIVMVFICAIIAVATQVQIASMERQIGIANRQVDNLQTANATLVSQIGMYYTLDEIEYFAISRLGMIHPDPSQVIEIYVPRQNNVELNASAHLLPSQDDVWGDVRTFLNGILDRMFGG